MALNKVLLLNEVQLLKLIQDNGYEDVANILENRHIDGQKFLELSEFQTFTWRLPPTQQKNLFNFIKRVKDDPFVILTQKPAENTTIAKKPKPNLPTTPKPDSFKPKPSFTQTTSQNTAPIKKNILNNSTEQTEFKQKPGISLDGNNSTKITPSPKDTSNTSISAKPSPIKITKPKPLLPDPDSDDEPNQLKVKPKAFLPEPTKGSNLLSTIKTKTQKPVLNKRRPSSPELTYEDIDTLKGNLDEDYLSPNEFDIEIEPENTYEPPPSIKNKRSQALQNKHKVSTEIPKPCSKEHKVSLVANRGPIPIPTKTDQSDDEMNDYEPIPEEKLRNLRNNMKTIEGYLNSHIEDTDENISTSTPEATTQIRKKITVEDLTNVIIVEREESRRPTNFLDKINSFFASISKSSKQDDMFKESSNYENHMLQSEMPTLEIPNFKALQNRPLPEIPVSVPTSSSSSLRKHNRILTKVKQPQPQPSSGGSSPRKINNIRLADTGIKVTKKATEPESKNRLDVMESQKEKIRTSVTDVDDIPEYENHSSIKTSASSSQRNSSSPMPILPDDLALKLSEALKARAIALKQNNDETNDEPFYGNIDETASQSSTSSYSKKETNLKAEDIIDDNETDESDQPLYGNIDNEEDVPEEEVLEEKVLKDKPTDNIITEEAEAEEEEEEELEEYIDSIFNINNEKFYRNTDRKGARQLLRNLEDGAFLFRPSRRYFLVLTLKNNGKYFNLGIERTAINKIRLNADSSSVSPEFGTLRAFVDYFTKEELTFKDGDNLVEICLKSVLPTDLF